MYRELAQYLILHKHLNIPGIGTFILERIPAETDVASRIINPPSNTISLHHGHSHPSRKLYSFLASVMSISERDAVIRFNDFVFEVRDKVNSGTKLEWEGVGTLSKGMADEIRFDTAVKNKPEGSAINAIKVLRENVQHTVRVGEDQRTANEMIQLLNHPEEKKSLWWVAAIILTLLSFLFIAYYFSVNGVSTESTGNQKQLQPNKTLPAAPAKP